MEGGAFPYATLGGVVKKRRELESTIQETIMVGAINGSPNFIKHSIERAADGEWRGEQRKVRQGKERGDGHIHVALVETWSEMEGAGIFDNRRRVMARSRTLGIGSVHNTHTESENPKLFAYIQPRWNCEIRVDDQRTNERGDRA